MKTVYLAGTKESKWRDDLIPMLKISHFIPDETMAYDQLSTKQDRCDFLLYVITPEGDISLMDMATLIQNSNRRPGKTIICWFKEYDNVKFDDECAIEIKQIVDIAINNGARFFFDLKQVAEYLNSFVVDIPYHPNVVECLIKRDGPTEITLNTNRYKFKKNELGDYVCAVMRKDHRNHLINLPDFRIYKQEGLPEAPFSDDEYSLLAEFKTMDGASFQSYVNGRIVKFQNARNRLKKRICLKWHAVNPKIACPVKASFIDEWLGLGAAKFEAYVAKWPQVFCICPPEEFAKAKDKWDRLIFAKSAQKWPMEVAA